MRRDVPYPPALSNGSPVLTYAVISVSVSGANVTLVVSEKDVRRRPSGIDGSGVTMPTPVETWCVTP
jgi:hypothetical protein|tara:strand:+ start:414 stop:614 length:201 start_codon:yes stop_codon:yes gene_type:complete